MPIKLNGATNGSVELNVPAAVGSDLQLTLPAVAGEVVVKATDGSVDLGSVDIDSSGRVGIGVSSLASSSRLTLLESAGNGQTLEIKGANTGGVGSQPGIKFTASTGDNIGGIFGDTNSDAVILQSGGTERMRIDSSGKVGIGTSSPTEKLHVDGNVRGGRFVAASGGAASPDYTFAADDTMGMFRSPGALCFSNGDTERMRITSSGRVGIGEDNPEAPLHVGFADSWIDIGQQSGNRSKIGFNNNIFYYGNSSSVGQYVWKHSTTRGGNPWDSGTERMRIDSSGNLLIGTSTLNSRGVSIYGSGANGLYIKTTDTCQYWITNDGAGTGSGNIATIYNDTTLCGSITVNGSSTAYNTGSDYRLKENVVNIIDGITRVKQLSPKRFNFIIDADRTVDGFLAHEAQTVVPEAVTGEKDGDEMQCIDQSKLVPLLTAALQEAITKIETLETKVATLEATS